MKPEALLKTVTTRISHPGPTLRLQQLVHQDAHSIVPASLQLGCPALGSSSQL